MSEETCNQKHANVAYFSAIFAGHHSSFFVTLPGWLCDNMRLLLGLSMANVVFALFLNLYLLAVSKFSKQPPRPWPAGKRMVGSGPALSAQRPHC